MAKRIIRIVLEVLSLLILLGTIVFLVVYWKQIPEQVPTHFGFDGQATAWSGKGSVLLTPVLMAVLYVSLFFGKTMRFRSLGKETRVPVPELMFPIIKLPLLAGIAYITVCIALARPLVSWCLGVLFGLAFVPLCIYAIIIQAKMR